MSIQWIRLTLAAAVTAFLVSGCGGGGSASAPVGGLTLTPGDAQITVTWAAEPGVDYWLFYAPTTFITPTSWATIPGSVVAQKAGSPYVATGLVNGVTYSFTMNARKDGGPGGDGTPSVSAVPRFAGAKWVVGGSLGSADMRGMTYGLPSGATANSYLAVGAAGSIFKSTDGVAWTAVASPASANLNATLYTLSQFMVVGASGTILRSSNLTIWNASASNTTQNLSALAGSGTLIVAVGDGGTVINSVDGVTWKAAASVPTTSNLRGVARSTGGVWVAVGDGGTIIRSLDGNSWNAVTSGTVADLNGIAAFGGTSAFVTVGSGGTVATSHDALTWTVQTLSPFTTLYAPVASNQFIVVGAGGAAYTSLDGFNWVAQTTGTSANLYAMIRAQAPYVAVGQSGISISTQ